MSQIVEYRKGMAFGTGIDNLDGKMLGDAVIKTDPEEISGTGGQTINFKMSIVDSITTLREQMGIDLSVDASWGLFEAGAKMSFAQSSSVNSYSVYVMVQVSVMNSFTQMRYVNLIPSAEKILKEGHNQFFKEKFGNKFVRGINTGGEFIGLIEIQTSSIQEKEDVKAKAKFNYGAIGTSVEVSAAFSNAVSRGSENKHINVDSFQLGGSETKIPDTVEEMVERATNFPANVKQESVPYSAQILDYITTENYPIGISRLEEDIAKDVLNYLIGEKEKVMLIKNNIDYILGNSSQFKNPIIDELNDFNQELLDILNQINRSAVQCKRNPKESKYPNFIIPRLKLPERKDKKIFVGFTSFPPKINGGEFQIILTDQKPKIKPKEKYLDPVKVTKNGRVVTERRTKYIEGEWNPFDWKDFENYVRKEMQVKKHTGITCSFFFDE